MVFKCINVLNNFTLYPFLNVTTNNDCSREINKNMPRINFKNKTDLVYRIAFKLCVFVKLPKNDIIIHKIKKY